MKKITTTVLSLSVLLLIFSCNNAVEKTENVITKKQQDSIASIKKAKEIENLWKYEEKIDKMTSTEIQYASCVSTNQLKFDFPYDGGSSFTLGIRKRKGVVDSYLIVDKGQFISGYTPENSSFKFDDNEIENYTFTSSDDGRSDIIFFKNTKKLIKNLKGAKKLMIEVPFYNEGRQVVEFDVEGLVWDN